MAKKQVKKVRMLTAKFTDGTRDTITVDYGVKFPGDAKERLYREAFTYDSRNPEVKKILDQFPVAKLEENYINFVKSESNRKKEIDDAIKLIDNNEWNTFQNLKKAGVEFNVIDNNLSEVKGIISLNGILECNKDSLFKIKLEMLEQDFIKDELKKPARPGQSHETPNSKKRKKR